MNDSDSCFHSVLPLFLPSIWHATSTDKVTEVIHFFAGRKEENPIEGRAENTKIVDIGLQR